jgi:hypothetical protein
MAVLGLRDNHEEKRRLVASIAEGEARAGDGAPVVTTWSAASRFAWATFDRTGWLRVDGSRVEELRRRLSAQGVDRFVFVTSDLQADRPHLAGLDVVWSDGPTGPGRRVLVVQEARRPS